MTITDVNDNVPLLLPCGEFEKANLDTIGQKSFSSLRRGNTFSVLENARVGTFVGQLLAEDADSGCNGEITFRLLRRHGLAAAARFELLANGSMFTALPLDREETATYQLMVEVADRGGTHVLSSTGIVCVTVLDDNDNDPHFVLPDGLYSFDSSLALLEKTGHRKSGFPRSREDQSDQAEIDPEASQRQSRQESEGTEEQLIEPSLRISLHEANGQLLTRLEATDPDDGMNGQVDYSLTSHPSPLRRVLRDSDTILAVNPTTGEVRLSRSLNTDDMGSHLFVVSATDRGQPTPRVEKKLLLVRVEDIPPQLLTSKGGESSSFSASTGSVVSLFHLGWNSDGKNVLLLTALIAVSVVLAVILISAMICMLKPCNSASRQRRNDQQSSSARFQNGRLPVGGPVGPTGVLQEARLIDSSMETFPDGTHDYGYGYTDAAMSETLHQALDGWEDQSNTFPLPRMVTTTCTGTVNRVGSTCSPVKEVDDGCSRKRTISMREDEQVSAANTFWDSPRILPVTLLSATCFGTSSFDKRTELLAIPTNCKPYQKLDFDLHLMPEKDRTSDSGQGGSDEEPHETLNLQPIVKIVQTHRDSFKRVRLFIVRKMRQAVDFTPSPTPHHQATVRAGQLSDAQVGAAAGDLVYAYCVHNLAPKTQAPGFHTAEVERLKSHICE
ncbi:unnamed protein product [Schistocephalus solidus]|uniref:Cadherin domain-containing protein n=1 Tax=Schistocephalus solidus TaxID=70667 RepID=A0A3P7EH89_SCHSO|nr:unnamed protein product [Schistocephalus solidus]